MAVPSSVTHFLPGLTERTLPPRLARQRTRFSSSLRRALSGRAFKEDILSRLSLRFGKSLLGGYQLGRLRGKGSFGHVWEAERPNGEKLALKFLRCGKSQDAAQEVRNILNVRQVEHPNLIRVDRLWADRGYLVIVMELADGSLQDMLTVCRDEFGAALPAKQACFYLSQAAEVLDFLNSQQHRIGTGTYGIQHCDVKPSNLLVCGNTVKLSDFSLSSLISASVMPHRVAGTFCYAAPEVFKGFLSKWTDQYALAASYCELRGGRPPFSAPPLRSDTAYVPPAPDLTMLPELEGRVVARALAPVPEERWRSCREFMDKLAGAIEEANPRA
jgi:serine/threonine protein kinase